MNNGFEALEGMRRHSAYLVTEEERAETQFSGDYAPLSMMDHFRRADIWLPERAEALLLATDVTAWYGLTLTVGVVPPGAARVSYFGTSVTFEPTVTRIGAWSPSERFSIGDKQRIESDIDIKANLALPSIVADQLPGLADLLPKVSARYRKERRSNVVAHHSVIRVISDGERRIVWQQYEDLQKIDPRQLDAKIIVGLAPASVPPIPEPLLTLAVECRCGKLGMRKVFRRPVEVSFHDRSDNGALRSNTVKRSGRRLPSARKV